MDERFQANQLRPGDAGFVYDKVVEFESPIGVADWDDEDDGQEISQKSQVWSEEIAGNELSSILRKGEKRTVENNLKD